MAAWIRKGEPLTQAPSAGHSSFTGGELKMSASNMMRKITVPIPSNDQTARGVSLNLRLRMRSWEDLAPGRPPVTRAPVILARGTSRERQRRRVKILLPLLG